MFLKKHKGEDIVVPSPEEIAKQEAKALEATLDFLRAPVKTDTLPTKEDASVLEGLSAISSEDISNDTSNANKESSAKEEFAEEVEEKKQLSVDVNTSEAVPATEETIDRTKYPAYKPISDDIKRGGRFRKVPNKVTAPPLQSKITPEIPAEKEPVKEIEADNETVIVPDKTPEAPSSAPLKNPLPTPAKHMKKEIDFDYAVDDKDMHFDIDVTIPNMYFDIN